MRHRRLQVALGAALGALTACDRSDRTSPDASAARPVTERTPVPYVEADGFDARMTFVIDEAWEERHRAHVESRKAELRTIDATLVDLDRLDAECRHLTSDILGPTLREYGVALDVASRFGPDAVAAIDRRLATLPDGDAPPRWAIHVLSRIGGDDAAHVATKLRLSKPTTNERLAVRKLADSSPQWGMQLRRSIGDE